MEYETDGTDKDIGSRAIIGGIGSVEHTSMALTDVLQQCLLAVRTFGVIGLYEATDDWLDRYKNVEGEVLRRVELYRKEFEKELNS